MSHAPDSYESSGHPSAATAPSQAGDEVYIVLYEDEIAELMCEGLL